MIQRELKQNLELRLENKPVEGRINREPIRISLLINSLYYFIDTVFIMAVKGGYRLMVIHKRKLLTDKQKIKQLANDFAILSALSNIIKTLLVQKMGSYQQLTIDN